MLFCFLISSIEASICSLLMLSLSSAACCRMSSSSIRRSSTSWRSAAARAARLSGSGMRVTSPIMGAAFSSTSLASTTASPTTAAIFSTTRASAR